MCTNMSCKNQTQLKSASRNAPIVRTLEKDIQGNIKTILEEIMRLDYKERFEEI